MPAKKDFVHLHTHSHFSMLEALATPAELLARAGELGQSAMALTDNGFLGGAVEFYKAAKKTEIKPIFGLDAYLALESRHRRDAQKDKRQHRIVLLARDFEGYKNLMKISTESYTDGFYYKPRVDWELLEKYRAGLLALSGSIRGSVPALLMDQGPEEAEKEILRAQKIFGKENFFLELNDFSEAKGTLEDFGERQKIANDHLIDLAKKTGAPLVAAHDVRYARPEDSEAHDVLTMIGMQTTVETRRVNLADADYSMRSSEEMWKKFSTLPAAVENSVEIAKNCTVELPIGRTLIPSFSPPNPAVSPREFLWQLAFDGLENRYGIRVSWHEILPEVNFTEMKAERLDLKKIKFSTETLAEKFAKIGTENSPEEIVEKLVFELETIGRMGFEEYFLIVWDFIHFAKKNGIPVGPGRGSGAGSITAFCLTITDLEPTRYGLLFERFLNPDRISMPDFDIDFSDEQRGEVIRYVTEKYGADAVSQVATFGTMAAKAAVRDVARVLAVPYAEADFLAKLIPLKVGITLNDAEKNEKDLQKALGENETYRRVYDLAKKLEGRNRNTGTHACAILISGEPLVENVPLMKAGKEEVTEMQSQSDMRAAEDMGLLKMDFLGLKNLSVMKYCLEYARAAGKSDVPDSTADIPLDDPAAFGIFQRGETWGLFQFESGGMTRYLKELHPSVFEDLIAMVALYRPGPMEFIPDFIARKHGKKEVTFLCPEVEPVLGPTYGVMVYQEQMMQLSRILAGFTPGEADMVRKGVAKKIQAILDEIEPKFLDGCEKTGHITRSQAEEVWQEWLAWAKYGFNKSHAACYALIAYHTAWLKAHFPTEFMAGLMTSDFGNPDRMKADLEECDKLGIPVLPPDINESGERFTVVER